MPKVNFVWSFIYEQTVHAPTVSQEFNYEKYQKFIEFFLKKVEPSWRKIESKIFDSCEQITGLKWKKKDIPVYLVKISSLMPFSDPLTIPIQFESQEGVFSLTPDRFIDMLVHELIHNLFIQNEKEMRDYFRFILNKYSNEPFDTGIHILLHAIHKKIFISIFGVEQLKEEIKMNNFYPAYKRSWEIVNQFGEDKIIQEFKNH